MPPNTRGSMAEQDVNPRDHLLDACKNASRYPYTLWRKLTSRAYLEWYHGYLYKNDDELFDGSKQCLFFWEISPGKPRFQMIRIRSAENLRKHLVERDKDPKCRYVFIEADHSRAPLNCSSELLKLLLTYHQVDPSFLDSLFTFGDQDYPLDAGLSHFHADDALAAQERLPSIESLGRSGQELRHSFLLRSLEKVEYSKKAWFIRHVAAYSSFDVVNGRTVWIIVQGNDYLRKQIAEDTADPPVQRQMIDSNDIAASFEAYLATHLLFFRWCEHDWRWFVRDMENRIRDSLIWAKTIAVESDGPSSTLLPPKMEKSRGVPVLSEKLGIPRTIKAFRRSLRTTSRSAPGPAPLPQQQQPAPPPVMKVPEGIQVTNMFKYKELQALSRLADLLEEAVLVIRLNMGVLSDFYEYFEEIKQSRDVGDELKDAIERSGLTSLLKVRQIIRRLEIRKTQLESLLKRLDDGKRLYENILQLRSLQVSRIFAEHGHRSAITMEEIARRTERETVSMHTITVVTLLFLPATFLCTFFQSGILQWKDTPDNTGDWLFRKDAFRLFMTICVPMTVLTLLAWLVVNIWARIDARKKASQDALDALAEVVPPPPGLQV